MALLGIDEVGRGPLAGPLVVGAVILPEHDDPEKMPAWIEDLKDSKKLAPKKRLRLSEEIEAEAVTYGLGWVMIEELNQLGMVEALKVATRRAVEEVIGGGGKFSEIIIDGDTNFLEGTPYEEMTTTVIKGDNLIKEVSAASILAKVRRDAYMVEIGEKYPEYGFERHMGYGTKEHLKALNRLGLCPEHRLFCKPVAKKAGIKLSRRPSKTVHNTVEEGRRAEEAVCAELEREGHLIIEQNFRTAYCEVDIISLAGRKLCFTEVKYRKDASHGGGLAAVDVHKLRRMDRGAMTFLTMHPEYAEFDPMLAVATVAGPDFVVETWFPVV